MARYGQGHLLYLREGSSPMLVAQPFNLKELKLTGDSVPVVDGLWFSGLTGSAAFSVSDQNVLAYQTGSAVQFSNLQWFDRNGKEIGSVGDTGFYTQVNISPDEKQVLFERREQTTGTYDIWLTSMLRGTTNRITFDPSSERDPHWAADGKTMFFSS